MSDKSENWAYKTLGSLCSISSSIDPVALKYMFTTVLVEFVIFSYAECLQNARKVNEWVGIRPGRITVRLELEEIKDKQKSMV